MAELQKEEILNLASAEATKLGLEVLHFVLRGSRSIPVLEITLDGERLVSIDDCETVSRSISQFIENSVNKDLNYRLDVLSPGTDEPLVYDYQLKRSLEKIVKVKFTFEQKESETTGKLVRFDDAVIEILEARKNPRRSDTSSSQTASIARADILSIRQVAVIR